MMKAGMKKRLKLAATRRVNPSPGIMFPLFIWTALFSTCCILDPLNPYSSLGRTFGRQEKYRTRDRTAIIDLYQTKKKAPTLRSRIGALALVLSKD
jgi:hypothetical protein